MENLSSGTTLYVRAFATNSASFRLRCAGQLHDKEESLVTIGAHSERYCLDELDLDYDGKLQASEAVGDRILCTPDLGIASL